MFYTGEIWLSEQNIRQEVSELWPIFKKIKRTDISADIF